MAKLKRKAFQKTSDKFWRQKLMQILHCLSNEELTWSVDNWSQYGVSTADRKRIEQEFDRWQRLETQQSVSGQTKTALNG